MATASLGGGVYPHSEVGAAPTYRAMDESHGPRIRIPPVAWWAMAGFALLALQADVYGAWIASGDFRVIQTGADPVPGSVKFWAIVTQILLSTVALGIVGWVLRGCIREKRLTFDAMLMMGWISSFWLDPVPNYIRPQVFFNSYYVNFGSWSEHIPGWVGPTGANLPNSLLVEFAAFVGLIIATVFGCWLMRQAQERWKVGKLGAFLAAVAGFCVLYLMLEEYLIQTGWLAWPGTIHILSIQGGTIHQMPVTEVALSGVFLSGGFASLRYFRDDQGHSFVERGIGNLRIGPRARRVISALAIIAYCQALWIGYNAFTASLALFDDTMPKGYPSYMVNQMCGDAKTDLCPSKTSPIYTRDTLGIDRVPGVDTGRAEGRQP